MNDILVICEHEAGKVKRYSREMLRKSSQVAGLLGCGVQALLFGECAKSDAEKLGEVGAKRVVVVTGEAFREYDADRFVGAAAKVIGEVNPSFVFATSSPVGRDILPRLSTRFQSGMATECIDVKLQNGRAVFTRPVYAGKVLADVMVKSSMKFATFRPNIFEIGDPVDQKTEVDEFQAAPADSKISLKDRVEKEAQQTDIAEADVIISGGRAVGSPENFAPLKELAGILNASIGASRAAVDAGYISHDHQVGQTGKTVNPTIYIACGISGAIQHLAGMKTSKIIIAINNDPEAPIFSIADFGVVGDIFKIVPLVAEKLRKARGI